jgi:hypothetical protein
VDDIARVVEEFLGSERTRQPRLFGVEPASQSASGSKGK